MLPDCLGLTGNAFKARQSFQPAEIAIEQGQFQVKLRVPIGVCWESFSLRLGICGISDEVMGWALKQAREQSYRPLTGHAQVTLDVGNGYSGNGDLIRHLLLRPPHTPSLLGYTLTNRFPHCFLSRITERAPDPECFACKLLMDSPRAVKHFGRSTDLRCLNAISALLVHQTLLSSLADKDRAVI